MAVQRLSLQDQYDLTANLLILTILREDDGYKWMNKWSPQREMEMVGNVSHQFFCGGWSRGVDQIKRE